jgi:DNA mismatch repair protein MutS2
MKTTSPYEAAIFAAEIGEAPSIDLHEENVNLALDRLETFLHREMMRGTEVIKIIHGRGTGTLRKAIHAWLQKQTALVPYFRDAEATHGAGGVTYAALYRIKK